MTNKALLGLVVVVAVTLFFGSNSNVFAQTAPNSSLSAASAGNGISAPQHTPAPGTILAKSSTPANINNGQWNEFSFFKATDPTLGCFSADPSGPSCTPSSGANSAPVGAPTWDFSVPANAHGTLTVTDAFHAGDNFQVFDGGLLGTTPAVATNKGVTTSDPDVTSASATWSSGTFALGSGPHTITVSTVKDSVDTAGGAAYFKVDYSCDEGYVGQDIEGTLVCILQPNPVIGPVGGSGISIDSSALLLAGVQGSALWMIPALASVGVGIGILSFRKSKKKQD